MASPSAARTPVVSVVPCVTAKAHATLDDIVKRGKQADLDLAKPYSSLDELIRRVNAVEATLDEFREFGHRRTYAQIGMVHEYLTNAVSSDVRLEELVSGSRRRQIDLKYGTDKFYFQVTRLFWGHYDLSVAKVKFDGLDNLTAWVSNRAAEKYAYILKHLSSKGVQPADVANYIEAFTAKGCRKKLFGIIDYERGQFRVTKPKPRIAMNENDAVLIAADKDIVPVATVPKPEVVTATAGMVILAGRVVNGDLEIVGVLDFDETNAAVKNAVSALARKLGIPAATEDDIKKLRAQLHKTA